MTDDRITDDVQHQETSRPPELADWWVWGVRKVAAPGADEKSCHPEERRISSHSRVRSRC